MKQILQNYKTGKLALDEVPAPLVNKNGVLVRNCYSLISAGTEKNKVDTARMSLLQKAKTRPDQVAQVITNVNQEGLIPTIKKVFNKLDTPISLGYSSVGQVLEVGSNVQNVKVGDYVACAGEGFAAHAEMVLTPQNMCAVVPEGVALEQAAFTAVGSIALQSVRLAQVELGHKVGVIGLGLIGQLVSQLAQHAGAQVLGIDIDAEKLAIATSHGLAAQANPISDNVEAIAFEFSRQHGLDAVIITAAGNQKETLKLAGAIAREKGQVVLLGAGDLEAPRNDYYHKELNVVISRAFGPGSYDNAYIQGHDYPLACSRWTVQRNMQTFLDLLQQKKLSFDGIITHRFEFAQAATAYEMINLQTEKYIGILFQYPSEVSFARKVLESSSSGLTVLSNQSHINAGFIGAGSFAQNYILPTLRSNSKVQLKGIATATGISAKNTARKFGFDYSSTDAQEVLNDKSIDTLFVVTRHDLHARFVLEAMRAGKKHIFVEKPLAVTQAELDEIAQELQKTPVHLMVGFNRRFSPLVRKTKEFFKNRLDPLVINYRVNAGFIAENHWIHGAEGGGRIIGEICHFIDLFQFLTDASPVQVYANSARRDASVSSIALEDNVAVTVKFSDGSLANLTYCSKGDLAYSRERCEVYGEGSIAVIDNFKKLTLVRKGKKKEHSHFSREMGVKYEIDAFTHNILNYQKPLIPFQQLYLTTLCTFKIIESLQSGQVQEIINDIPVLSLQSTH